jgi:hypothetical protein
MNKHTVIGIAIGLGLVALGGYFTLPVLSSFTNIVAKKTS